MIAITGLQTSVDTHAHIFDPIRFPFHPSSTYDVDPTSFGTIADYRAVLDSHGITHAVLVNSVGGYGYDNKYILSAIKHDRQRLRGIGIINHDITDRELQRLKDGGIVGCRFNVSRKSLAGLSDVRAAKTLARLRDIGWFVQMQTKGDELLEVLPVLVKSKIRIVISHFGRPDLSKGLKQPGFEALYTLAAQENTWIKLSAPFRMSMEAWPHEDVTPYLQKLMSVFTPDRCLWGSDWPFTQVRKRVDFGPMLSFLLHHIPDRKDQQKILWDTPAALFEF